MRDLLFKNITSEDRRRRIISSCEVVDNAGVRSIIRRHLVCLLQEVQGYDVQQEQTHLYVVKERHTHEHRERFFCKMKGNIYAVYRGRLFRILFTHSLSVNLKSIPEDAVNS